MGESEGAVQAKWCARPGERWPDVPKPERWLSDHFGIWRVEFIVANSATGVKRVPFLEQIEFERYWPFFTSSANLKINLTIRSHPSMAS